MRTARLPALVTLSLGTGALLAAAGCNSATGPNGLHSVSLSVAAAGQSTASAAGLPSLDVTQGVGSDTLVLHDVTLVIGKLELEAVPGSCTSASAADTTARSDTTDTASGDVAASEDEAGGDSTADAGHEESRSEAENDGCAEVQTGPLLAQIPLDSAVHHVAQVDLPAGTYGKVEFRIRPPMRGQSSDSAFLAAHPDLAGVSIKVTGTYDGKDFTFEQGLDAAQDLALEPPLVVSDTTTQANLTLSFDVRTWFRGLDGSLIDPSTASTGGPNAELVAHNIEVSVRGFEDCNQDGRGDSGPTGR